MTILEGLRVVDLGSGISAGYCSKLLVDAGAAVTKLESPEGDALRNWAIGAKLAPGEDGPLFQYLSRGKTMVTASPDDLAAADEVLRQADAIIWTPGSAVANARHPESLRALNPSAIVVSMTPFGLTGPWVDRPATEFTLQAMAGGIARGTMDRAPVQVGGRQGEWIAGALGTNALLTALKRRRSTGTGELVDVSMLESLTLTHSGMHPVTARSLGMPSMPGRRLLLPGIHPTQDGYVAFMVVTNQQWQDFCVLIEKAEWSEDPTMSSAMARYMQPDVVREAIEAFTTTRTTDEVAELASLFRVPVAPVGRGDSVPAFDQFEHKHFYATDHSTGVVAPTVSYAITATEDGPSETASSLGDESLPFSGLRVLDFTAFWAGPIVGHFLAIMGADVIHVEAASRPDGMRMLSSRQPPTERWWEYSSGFIAGNTNKRDITLDLSTPRGRELARELARHCDVVIENYSPRVMDNMGLDYESLRAVNPNLVMLRMPAYGLDGPWRDRTGYAQTMEAVSGMAWMTGYADEAPVIPNGNCDPIGGIHATLALLLALERRDRDGGGALVEAPMVGGALSVAAELVIEHSAHGFLMTRNGNRGPTASPQNLYRTSDIDAAGGNDSWVAIAVETAEHWRGLRAALGDPEWARGEHLDDLDARRSEEDVLDKEIAAWCESRAGDDIAELLASHGVPAARVIAPNELETNPQIAARGFVETFAHALEGEVRAIGYPARFSAGPAQCHRGPAPTLGQHNTEVLGGLLGLSDAELAQLEADGVVGTALPGF